MAIIGFGHVQVPVLDRYARAFPTHLDAQEAVYGPIAEACATTFAWDAHVCAMALPSVPKRLGGAYYALGPKMVLAIFDVDAPNHRWTPEWWAVEEPKVRALFADVGRGYAFTTRGGYRIIFALREELTIDSPQAALRWRISYLEWIAAIKAEHKIDCDPACADPTRLYRLARVRRDSLDTALQPYFAEIGECARMLEWRAPYVAADDPRVLRTDHAPIEVREPAPVSEDKQIEAVRHLAAAWPPRRRHDAMLALCGALSKAGWSAEATADFASAVIGTVRRDGHPEHDKWLKAAHSTREKVLAGLEVTGWATLTELMVTGRDGAPDESRRPAVEAAVLAAQRCLGQGPASDLFEGLGAQLAAANLRAALGATPTAIPEGEITPERLAGAAAEYDLPMTLLDKAAEVVLAMGAASGAGPQAAPKKLFTSWKLFKDLEIKPPEWLVRDLITRGGIGVISAEPKSTKTWLASEIAIALASGTPVVGRFAVDRPGVAAYFYAEDQAASVGSHTRALLASRKLEEGTWEHRLHVQPRGRALDVTKDYDLAVLLASCWALGEPIDLLILDPLRDVHSGEEDKSDSMTVVMKRLRGVAAALNCAVLFVHHSSKSTADTKTRRHGQKMRGSSAVHGAVDCGIYLFDLRGDGKQRFINGICSEVKGARSGGTMDLTLDLEDDADGVAIRASWSTAERTERAPEDDADERMVEVVQRLFDQGAPLTRDALARKVSGGAKKLQPAIDAALNGGLIETKSVDGRPMGYEITEAGRQLIRTGREPAGRADTPEPAPGALGGFIASLVPQRN